MKAGIDYTGLCVVFYCHDGNGNVLFGKRGKNSRDDICRWDIGGGKVEFDANVIQTLRDEIMQEYGTIVLNHDFLGYRDVHRVDEQQRKTHWVGLDFKVLIDRTLARNNEPHKLDEVRWFKQGEWPSPAHSQFPEFLRLYWVRLGLDSS